MNKINGYTEEEAKSLVEYIWAGKQAGKTLTYLFETVSYTHLTTATVFCQDATSGAAVFAKAVKENAALTDKIVPKCAYLEKKYLDKNGVKELAAIPSKEVLIAKMLGCLQSSISKFVYVLDSIAKAKEAANN